MRAHRQCRSAEVRTACQQCSGPLPTAHCRALRILNACDRDCAGVNPNLATIAGGQRQLVNLKFLEQVQTACTAIFLYSPDFLRLACTHAVLGAPGNSAAGERPHRD